MRPSIFEIDPKTESAKARARGLRELGIQVRYNNPTRAYEKQCPHTDYNFLEAVIDSYHSQDPSKQKNTGTFFRQTTAIIVPPPPPGAQNEFFINGGRSCGYCIGGKLVIDEPEKATLGEIHRIASDVPRAKELLQETADWELSKKDKFKNSIIREARSVLALLSEKNEHHFGDFLKHVKDPLAPFDESGWLADAGEFASARISDARTGDEPIYIVCMVPLSHLRDYAIYTSLFANAFFQSIKNHPTGRPIHHILEEFTIMQLPDFAKEMLVLRGLGGSAEIYVQSRLALAQMAGQHEAETIYEQSDIVQITAPNDQEASRLSSVLGSRNVKEVDASVKHEFEEVQFTLKDTEEPLMSMQALYSMPRDEQIIKVRGMRPIKAKKIPWWEVAGLRDFIDPSPLEGPPPQTGTKASLRIGKNGVDILWPRPPKLSKGRKNKSASGVHFLRPASLLWLVAWMLIAVTIRTDNPIAHTSVLLSYTYQGSRHSPIYTSCSYLSLSGHRFTLYGGSCPFIRTG